MLSAPKVWREAPLANFKNEKDFEAWLQRKPREVAVALAVRAALRVLPFSKDTYTYLQVFRAIGVGWAAAKYPAQGWRLAARLAAADIDDRYGSDAKRAAGRAAAAAADRTATRAAAAAAYAAAACVGAADRVTAAFWSTVSADAARVKQGVAASAIVAEPLWPNGQPDHLRSSWLVVKNWLHAAEEDWEVWTDWYEDRLAGRVRAEAHELAYMRIDNYLWEQGAAVVNAEIKRRIAALEAPPPPPEAIPEQVSFGDEAFATVVHAPPLEAIPEQTPAATNFRVNSEGLIDVVPDPPAPQLLTDALQREVFSETRRKAKTLAELGANLLGDVNGPARAFRESLPDKIEDLSIIRSWSRGNTLRSRIKAHDLSMNNGEPDPARLPPLVAEMLRDLIHTWNIFIVGDPNGRELDEIRLGPQEVNAARQMIPAAVPIIVAIKSSENVATPLAIEAVAEQADAAKNAPVGIDGDQAVELSRETTGNFVAEMLRNAYSWCRGEGAVAWKEYRAGIYRQAGTATFKAAAGVGLAGIIAFVVRYADTLKGYVTTVWHNPTVVEIIDWIVRVWLSSVPW